MIPYQWLSRMKQTPAYEGKKFRRAFMNHIIRPPSVLEISDPQIGLTAWLAVDSMIGHHFCGGLRMLPNVSEPELRILARAMTLKLGFLGIPHGGAKAGILCGKNASKEDKLRLLAAFGQNIQGLLSNRVYLPGSDMGTNDRDIRDMFRILGIPVPKRALRGQMSGWYTSLTVIASAKVASAYQGFNLSGATVAIEGFGAVGGSVAQGLENLGSKVVAISTSQGALHAPHGLDVATLLHGLHRHGARFIDFYDGAERIDKEALLELKVDVLLPCARHHSIHMGNAGKIKARMISSGSNAPITEDAEKALSHHGILSVPDFISNAGGVLGGTMEFAGLSPFTIEQFVDRDYSRQVFMLLDKAHRESVYIRDLAEQIALERFARMADASRVRSVRSRAFSFALDMYRAGMIPTFLAGLLSQPYFRRRIKGKV
jgi:glutamate dehydrogenase (NAD(P)+)